MGLLDGLEKLINEHGSATILKERIELANDKYAALERKLSESEKRIQQLELEKQGFELENYKLKEKLKALEEQLAETEGQRLEEIRERLLVALSSRENTAPQLCQTLGIGEQLATFHLQEMEKMHFVSASYFYTGQPTIWRLAQEGRRYLVSHGLLK